jgi:hypothetical protein
MAGPATIREFLVGLGFNINQNQLQQFNTGIAGATLTVGRLATAVEAAAAAVVIGVERIADRFEELYYASKRIGTTVTNIESLEFAARQIGIAGGEATAALENLASMMRTQPGTEGLLGAMGVQTRQASGAMRDMTDIQQDFIKRLREMPYFMATQFAQMFGISERTLYQLINRQNEAIQKQDTYRQKVREWGLDLDDVAAKSREFMNRLRDVGAEFDLLTTKVQSNLMPVAERWLVVMQRLFDLLKSSQSAFSPLQASLDKLVQTLDVLVTMLEGRGLDALGKFSKMIYGGEEPSDAQKGKMRQALSETPIAKAWRWLQDNWGGGSPEAGATAAVPGAPPAAAAAPPAPNLEPTTGEAIMGFFKSLGWTHAQAAGIAGNLQAESNFNPQATGDKGSAFGIAQWHPDRQRAFEQWSGKPMQQASMWDQLRFVQHELTEGAEQMAGNLLKSATSAAEAAGIVSKNYERPADTVGEMQRRGVLAERLAANSNSVTFNQKTDIHVSGGEAGATGRAVGEEQRRVNADLTRNLAGAVR